ncbi:DNA glycosylase [Pseudomassariella vexata]|uniref:DNA glycosylase n=1 Tax=Pseudomassariella vexata TaxID=1141098 RepID=A0A1Y2E1W3_9PEZI|nr:DNA glycosylase [Pseudomassariella vexata]ORY65530.1 DNA glycosylase [Pseudomassariella vexata]
MPPPAPKSRKRKAAADPVSSGDGKRNSTEGEYQTPSTPNKRRAKTQPAVPSPGTPTPNNAKLMAEPVTNGTTTTPKPKPGAVNRLADPRATNATLLSPETSRVVTSKSLDAVSPSKAAAVKTTTSNILEEACAHLISVDPRMKPLINGHHCHIFSPEGLAESIDPFESLCSGIISQQVSGAAAKAIKKRFVDLFDGDARFPQPSQVAATSFEKLRSAGLSQRKAEYVQGLAEKFTTGELSARLLHDAPYEEVLEKLIAVRGLGKWSVEMFACFGLKRMDVFSLGDLGVQRGMAAFAGRDVSKLKSKGGKWKYMSEKDMEEMAAPFAPYRSVFMWYMWRVEETDVSTLE